MTKETIFINQLKIQFNWKVALVITICILVLVKLGFWQLNRAELKRQLQTELLQHQNAIPKPIKSLLTQHKQTLNQQRVRLIGHYINDKSIYISNKFYQGRPGYEVFTPFQLKSSDQIVLISRGWISRRSQQNILPAIDLIIGEQELVGTIHLPTGKSFYLAEKIKKRQWPIRLHHFQMETIVGLLQNQIPPYVVRLEAGNIGILQPFWTIVRHNADQSTAYAIQWFIMAIGLSVITIIRSSNIVQLIQSKL